MPYLSGAFHALPRVVDGILLTRFSRVDKDPAHWKGHVYLITYLDDIFPMA